MGWVFNQLTHTAQEIESSVPRSPSELRSTMAQESVELRSRSVVERPLHQEQNEDVPDSNPDQNPEFSLPPVDSGKAAWLFLAACWGVEAVTFGKSISQLPFITLTHTFSRIRKLIRRVPELLQHTPALRWIRQHCGHRHHHNGKLLPLPPLTFPSLPPTKSNPHLRESSTLVLPLLSRSAVSSPAKPAGSLFLV